MRAHAEPNVTPLIDVMLVLLILFMVVTPTAQQSLDASVPRAASERAEPPPRPVVLSIDDSGLRLNGTSVTGLSDLRLQLERALGTRSDRTVFVRAGPTVRYGDVVEAMDTARGAGADRLGILSGTKP
jgi:biopolymer transport protein ExbD